MSFERIILVFGLYLSFFFVDHPRMPTSPASSLLSSSDKQESNSKKPPIPLPRPRPSVDFGDPLQTPGRRPSLIRPPPPLARQDTAGSIKVREQTESVETRSGLSRQLEESTAGHLDEEEEQKTSGGEVRRRSVRSETGSLKSTGSGKEKRRSGGAGSDADRDVEDEDIK